MRRSAFAGLFHLVADSERVFPTSRESIGQAERTEDGRRTVRQQGEGGLEVLDRLTEMLQGEMVDADAPRENPESRVPLACPLVLLESRPGTVPGNTARPRR